ncbi:serine/threonine protein kinase [Bifidobacterium choerinum]|uniref:Serine/threonine protein kinase n=1 Tax=Bifidobacterium choerinum TaxID=35760 RepID=A0A087AHC4_9BIFI|nr:serine/threonine protein kinase [Bifidobacterium choerinum]
MMICQHCGSNNDPKSKFCTRCGKPLQPSPSTPSAAEAPSAPVPPAPSPSAGTPPAPMPGAAVPPPAPSASFGTQSSSVPPAPTASAAAAQTSATDRTRRWLVWAIVAVAIVVVAVIAGLLTYNAELWGGKTLPQAQAATLTSKDAVSADTVAAQLRSKGLHVKKTKEFSGAKKGAFLGYRGADAGARVKAGSTVEVRESAGAGVPDRTVGKKAKAVTKTFADMGVPVHYKKVLVSDSSKTAEGTVVSTSPEPGQAVSEQQPEIYIGVADKQGSGIPMDIMGRDVDDVASELESKGYDVSVRKRLASKQYIGKVSGSQPAPGSVLESGQSVTLFQGVDAQGAKDTFIQSADDTGDTASMAAAGASTDDVASGRWCTKGGDCITLGDMDGEEDDLQDFGVVDGAKSDDYAMADSPLVVCDAVQQAFCSQGSKDYLIQGDTGAFELMPHKAFTGFWCGDTFLSRTSPGATQYCKAGKVATTDNPSDVGKDTGGKYRMSNFFVVAPVGADLDKLEASGYFDKSALDAVGKQQKVDTDRPFLLYRDVKQYADDEREADYSSKSLNPFLPYNSLWGKANGVKDASVAMRPAPSDATAYYLCETSDLDWDALEDADVDGAAQQSDKQSDKDKKQSDEQSDDEQDKQDKQSTMPTPKELTPQQIRASVDGGDMSPIAGRYCLKDGSTCLTLDAKGNVTESGKNAMPLSSDDPNSATVSPVAEGARPSWDIPASVGIEFRGPDSDYRCGSERGYAACYESGTFYSEAEITKPVNFVYIFKGADSEQVKSIAQSMPEPDYVAPDSTKPFIKLLGYHMNVSPSDGNVFYLTE